MEELAVCGSLCGRTTSSSAPRSRLTETGDVAGGGLLERGCLRLGQGPLDGGPLHEPVAPVNAVALVARDLHCDGWGHLAHLLHVSNGRAPGGHVGAPQPPPLCAWD